MAYRMQERQSGHDAAVRAAANIYRQHGKHVWINPGSEKNKSWLNRYVDVIAAASANANRAWVIEIQTADSVSDTEARDQWKDYDGVYTQHWYLAVPVGSKEKAQQLLRDYSISHCTLVTWRREPDGTYTFWGLPGLRD